MNKPDLLADYRKSSQDNSRSYTAFTQSDVRQSRVLVCPYLRAWEWLPYWGLNRIVVNSVYGTEIVLVYGFAVVVIKGKNLLSLGPILANEKCCMIQEFDPERFDVPTDLEAPYVDSMDILVETRDQMVSATDAALTSMAKSRSTQGH